MALFSFAQDLFKYILPQGVPRNSLIILAGEGGSGKSVILTYIIKEFITKNEPVIYVAIDDDPETSLNQFNAFGIDIDKFCKEKRLIIVDGFSYLVKGKKSLYCVEEEVVSDNIDTIISVLSKIIDRYQIENKGIIVMDSINEPMMQLDPTRFLMFIKSLRANFAKSRKIFTIVTLHTSTESFKEYLLTIEHLVDGILETGSIPDEMAQQLPLFIRQMRVRKLKGAVSLPGWVLYGIDSEGLKPVILRVSKSPTSQ